MSAAPDANEIQRAIKLLFPADECAELRSIGGRATLNGFYLDHQKLAADAHQLSQAGENVFVCLNPIRQDLYPRSADAICRTPKGGAASDADVVKRRWLLLDFDSKRPKNTSATEQQLAAAEQLTQQAYRHLEELRLPKPAVVLSGNGHHMWLPLADWPNDEASRWACERFLSQLAEQFKGDGAHLDVGMWNAARIATLPGSIKRKGSNLANHPHRMAKILAMPDAKRRASLEQILAIVGQPPTKQTAAPVTNGSGWDVEALLTQRGLAYQKDSELQTASGESAARYVLAACPFEPEHQGSAVLLQFPSGAVAFRCLGNRCQGKDWQQLKQLWNLGGISASDIVLPQPQAVQTIVDLPDHIQAPEQPAAAFYGPLGKLVQTYAPHTEASPISMLSCLLTYYGNALGRRYFNELDGKQFPKLFTCLIGRTAKGRKFTADQNACRMMDAISPSAELFRHTGLSTGEGLIKTLLDFKDGILPAPAVFQEGEFASVLKRKERRGNSLDDVLRNAWDDVTIGTQTRAEPLRASGSHVSLVVHCTPAELKELLSARDLTSGFANRFLWIHSQRSQRKADVRGFAASVAPKLLHRMQSTFQRLLDQTSQPAGEPIEVRLTADAQAAWEQIYRQLDIDDADDDSGLLEDLCARLPAYVRRLSLIYCLADGAAEIGLQHLEAALALCEYSRATLDYVYSLASWSDSSNQPELLQKRAARFLRALQVGQELTRKRVVHEVYQRNRTAREVNQIRDHLLRANQLRVRTHEGTEYWQRIG